MEPIKPKYNRNFCETKRRKDEGMINEKSFFIPDKNRTYLSLKVFIVILVT